MRETRVRVALASSHVIERCSKRSRTDDRSVRAAPHARERAAAASARGETATTHAHAKQPRQLGDSVALFIWRKRPHNSHKIATYSMKKISSVLFLMVGKDGALAPLAPHIPHIRGEALILPRVDVREHAGS